MLLTVYLAPTSHVLEQGVHRPIVGLCGKNAGFYVIFGLLANQDELLLKHTGSESNWSHGSIREQADSTNLTPTPHSPSYYAKLRWRNASNRQIPVATETLRLSTLPAIGM